MRTTIRLDDSLLARAKHVAGRRGLTLNALIEQGLRLVLAKSRNTARRKRLVLPVCLAGGGLLPGVDLNNGSALLDSMEGRC